MGRALGGLFGSQRFSKNERFLLSVVLPDVGARLPDVVSPAQQWGAGEYQCPGPAHHQETLGDPPPVKLALPWERSSNWVCVCCNCKVFLELLFWREIQECKLFIYYLELTGNLMMRNLQREREARLHMATIPAVQSLFWHPHSTTVHLVLCFVLLKCHSGQILLQWCFNYNSVMWYLFSPWPWFR